MSVTIITGGASWIALDVARRLVSAGGRLVLADRNDAARAEVEAVIGDRGLYLTGDVRSDDFLDEVITAATDIDQRVAGVVTAAVTFEEAALATTREAWQRALDINLVSAAVLTKVSTWCCRTELSADSGSEKPSARSSKGSRRAPSRRRSPSRLYQACWNWARRSAMDSRLSNCSSSRG